MKRNDRYGGKVLTGLRRQRAICGRWLARVDVLITSFALCWLAVRFLIFALRSSR